MPVLWWVSSGLLSGDDYPDRERQPVWLATDQHLRPSACLCRMVAFPAEYYPGNICACINQKRRSKLAEESGSMWLLDW
jgi:hypothetical protein